MLSAVTMLFALRFLVGLAEAPSFPGNARIVAAWFPSSERGTASAIFNSAQYFSLVAFAPLMGWIVHNHGWRTVFYVMGGLGVLAALAFVRVIHDPVRHPTHQFRRAGIHRSRRRPGRAGSGERR